MNKYNDIEIETAKNLLEQGYKWIVRYEIGRLIALSEKPIKSNNNLWTTTGNSVCVGRYVPIFQSIRSGDKEPTSLESVVHPQILDDAEREYLKGVIRPFKDKIVDITKRRSMSDDDKEYISILFQGPEYTYTCLPYFKTGAMYKGMKTNREYTIKELGL